MAFTFQTFPAPLKLQQYIRNFWFFETDSTDDGYVHYATASVFPKITFGLAGRFYSVAENGERELLYCSGLNGQTNSFSRLTSGKGKIQIFGAFLFPHSLHGLTGLPADVFTNQNVDLKTIWGNDGLNLEEQVLMAADNLERIKLVCSFLERKLKSLFAIGNNKLAYAVDHLLSFNGIADIKQVAGTFCLSLRQFERKFKAMSGFSPKHFHRISRFEQTTFICLQNRLNLTEIAYSFGYADQAHFTHDFKNFSGFSPRTYLKLAAEDVAFTV